MNIIIAGDGKVGLTLARQLSAEGHDLTLIDLDNLVLEQTMEQYDVCLLYTSYTPFFGKATPAGTAIFAVGMPMVRPN